MGIEILVALTASLVPSLAGIIQTLLQTARDRAKREEVERDTSRQGVESASAAREALLTLAASRGQELDELPASGAATGAEGVLASSTDSWSDENRALVESAAERRAAAARLNRFAAVIGGIAALIFAFGILWALVTQQPIQALTATLGLIPGAVSTLIFEQAKRATTDARADEAALRTQVHYQRRAAYALQAVSLINDPSNRDQALTSLAVTLGPTAGGELPT